MEGNRSMPPEHKHNPALLIGIGVAVALLGGYFGVCAWVGQADQVMPNVSVSGVDVGGLSKQQTTQQLSTAYEQASFALDLSYGTWNNTLSQTAWQLQAEESSQLAWKAGREHFLTQGALYLAHLLGKSEQVDAVLEWTEEGLSSFEQQMDEADLQVGGGLTHASYAVEGDQLMLTKGVTGVTVDREQAKTLLEQSAADALTQSLSSGTEQPTSVTLPSHESGPQAPDFEDMHQQLYRVAENASVDPETHEVVPHVVGLDFDVNEAKSLYDQAKDGETFAIPLTLTEPEETTESLESKLFRDVLGEATSAVSGSSNRKSNVKLSASACNGIILMPGEVFSYNNTTGSRTTDKGYLPATAYVGGASVDEIGGGICQTSSTIYYAVLHTTLEIVERHAHRYAVGYVPDGMDATVYFGSLDFQFKNNTNYPIKIVTKSYDQNGKRYLNVAIYGTNEDGRYAQPERVQYDYITPTVQYQPSESVPRGTTVVDSKQTPYTGRSASTTRYIYDKNGNLLEKQDMGVSNYKMRPKTILYNPADGDPSTWVNGTPPAPVTEKPQETPATGETTNTPQESAPPIDLTQSET